MFGNHEDLLNAIDIESIENAIAELKKERPDLNIVDRTISITDGIIMLLEITGQGGSHMLESQLEYRYEYIAISNAAPGLNDEGEEVVIENMLEYDGDDQYQRDALFQYFKSTVLNQIYLIRRLYSGYSEAPQKEFSIMENNPKTDTERQVAVPAARQSRDLPPLSHERTETEEPVYQERNLPPLCSEIKNTPEYVHEEVQEETFIEDDQEFIPTDDEEIDYPPLNGHEIEDVVQPEETKTLDQDVYLKFDIQQRKNRPSRNKHHFVEETETEEVHPVVDDEFGDFYPVNAEDISNEDATVIDPAEYSEYEDDYQEATRTTRPRKGVRGMFT